MNFTNELIKFKINYFNINYMIKLKKISIIKN